MKTKQVKSYFGFVTEKQYRRLQRETNSAIEYYRFRSGLDSEIIRKLKSKLRTYLFFTDIEQYLLEEGHDVRMEELTFNLIEQMIDNPEWIQDWIEENPEYVC